jgi:hypothetical protein
MKKIVVTIHLIVTALSICLSACGQSPKTTIPTMNKVEMTPVNTSNTEGVETFITNFKAYHFDIQAAGIANLPMASLSKEGVLEIDYTYRSEGENRTGKMQLTKTKPNHFKGNWKTNADNGNVYQGSLYLDFATNGTAKGFYKYGGSDYSIILFLKDDKK